MWSGRRVNSRLLQLKPPDKDPGPVGRGLAEIVERSLADIRPYPGNPGKNRDAVQAVTDSIREYGVRQPIVIDPNDVIAGHTRYLAAEWLGLGTVPVHVAEGLTPDQARAYRIMDNRSHENATWEENLLKFEFEGLLDSGFDLDLTGFTGPEINTLLSPEATSVGEDDLILPPENPVAAPGDIWQCGSTDSSAATPPTRLPWRRSALTAT